MAHEKSKSKEHLENSIGYTFKNNSLLQTALTHTSYCYETKLDPSSSNEKLEFLGDAVLELSVSAKIYNDYPELGEGELTKLRAGVVCESTIAKTARKLDIGRHLKLGRGEIMNMGYNKDSILSDAFEALTGAVYLDGGFESARNFVLSCLEDEIATLRHTFMLKDPKTLLQEKIQKVSREPLKYSVVKESGAEHDKLYFVNVSHMGRILGKGCGKNKKEAEQNAALYAVKKMDV